MLHQRTCIRERLGAIVASPVESDVIFSYRLCCCLQLYRAQIVDHLHHLDGIALGFVTHGQGKREFLWFQSLDSASRKEERTGKENDPSKVILFLLGHVFCQTFPKTEIKEEAAPVAAVDMHSVGILTRHRVKIELEPIRHICKNNVGEARGYF